MARSVGSIEVTVDADTGRLKAQMVRDGKIAGEATARAINRELSDLQAKIDVETQPAIRAAQLLRKRMEAALEGVPVDIDFERARAQLREFELQAQALDAEMHLEVSDRDLAAANGDLELLKAKAEQDEIEMQIDLRTALAEAEAEAMVAEIERLEAEIQLDLDTKAATLALFRFKEETEADRIEFDVDLDLLGAQIRLDKFRLEQEANALNIDVDLDLGVEEAKMAAFRRELAGQDFSGAGGEASQSFSKGFGGGFRLLPGQVTEWLPLIGAALEPATVAIEGLASGAVQVLSSAFAALAGTAGALLPIMAGLGAVAGAVGIGFLGIGKGIGAVTKEFSAAAAEGRNFNIQAEDIRKAMEGLSPAAQSVVAAFADLFPQLQAVQRAVSERLLAGLDEEMRQLGQETIPDLANAFAQAGSVANRFFVGLSDELQQVDFSQTFAAISPALDSLGRAIINVVGSIQPFMEAAAPAARELGAMIERASQAFRRLVEAGNESGGITRFLDQGLDSLRVWGDLVANVTRALFTLFDAGRSGGDSMVKSLSDIVGRFNDWMKSIEGQNALQQFFDDGRRILSAFVPVLEGLADAFDNLITPGSIERFAQLSEEIGNVLPVLGSLLGLFGQTSSVNTFVHALSLIADAIEPIIPSVDLLASVLGQGLSRVVDQFAEAAGDADSILDSMAVQIEAVADAIAPLIPRLAEVAVNLLKAWTPIIAAQVEGFADSIEALGPLLDIAADLLVTISRVLAILGPIMAKVVGIFAKLLSVVLKFATTFSPFVKALELGSDALEFITDKVEDFIGVLDRVPFLGDVLDFVGVTSSSEDAAEGFEAVRVTAEDMAPAIEDAARAAEGYTPEVQAAAEATVDLQLAAKAAGLVATELISPIDDAAAVVEGYTDESLAAAAATAESTRSMQRNSEAAQKLEVDFIDATRALTEMDGAFEVMSRREGALENVFALGNAPEAAATATRDIEESLEDLKEALKEIKVGDILAGNFKADDFLDAMDELRPAIQAKVTEVFTTDGAPAARATALKYIAQVTEALGGAFTPAQVAQMLGLDDFEGTIKLAVELEGIEKAKAQLDILTGLGGTTPLTATILLALDTGQISAEAATAINNLILQQQFNIPANVLPAVSPEAMAAAQAFVAEHPGLMPVGVEFPGELPPLPVPPPLVVPVTLDLSQIGQEAGELGGLISPSGSFLAPQVVSITADPSEFFAAAGTVHAAIGELASETASPVISADTTVPEENIAGLVGSIGSLDALTAAPTVTLPGYPEVNGQVDTLMNRLTTLDTTEASASVTTPGAADAVATLDTLTAKANALDGKTIDIIINQQGLANFANGGIVGPRGGIGGESGTELAFFHGQTRLLNQPTRLSPGTVVVPVGSGPSGKPMIQRVVNNYLTITPQSADPAAVATQVINRAAALANR